MASELDIKIAGISLDLFDNEEQNFYLTKQIHDLSNLETRDASFSKTIAVPLTSRNLQILENNLPTLYRHTEEPIYTLPAEVLLKGVPVLNDAYALIREQTKKARTVNVTIVGGTARFFNQLKDDPLSALNFTELNLEWTLDGIKPIVEARGDSRETFTFDVIGQTTTDTFRPTFEEDGAGLGAFVVGVAYYFDFEANTFGWESGNYTCESIIDDNQVQFSRSNTTTGNGVTGSVEGGELVPATGIQFTRTQWYTNESRRLYDAEGGNDAETKLNEIELGESGFLMYFKTLLDKIFSNLNNLTVDYGDLANDADFVDSGLFVPVPIVHDSFGAIEGSYSEVQNNGYDLAEGFYKMVFPDVIENDSGLWIPANNQYEFTEAGFYIVRFFADVQLDRNQQSWSIYKNFDTAPERLDTYKHFLTEGGIIEDIEVVLETSVNVVAGDVISMYADSLTGIGKSVYMENSSFQIEAQGIGRGRTLNISSVLPSIGQKTFVKEIFKLYNVLVIEEAGIIKLSYFESIPTNEPVTLEFNNKQEQTFLGGFATYGQTNILKYIDNEEVERLDANSSFPINDQTLPAEVEKIVSEFSATDQSTLPFNEDGLTVPNYDLEYQFVTDNKMTISSGSINFTTQDRNTILAGDFIAVQGDNRYRVIAMINDFEGQVDTPFVSSQNDRDWYTWRYIKKDVQLHIGKFRGGFNNMYVNDGGFTALYNSYGKAEFTPLLWNNLLEKYYKLLSESMLRPFIVVGWMSFGVLKYIAINGLQPIYIEEHDSYFYANKIEQWKYNGSTRVELVKINY